MTPVKKDIYMVQVEIEKKNYFYFSPLYPAE